VYQKSNVAQSDGAVKERWDRARAAHLLEHYHQSGLSQEEFATQHHVPPRTLGHWIRREQGLEDDPQRVAFFESPAGVEFLHQMHLAAHLCFHQMGNSGLRLLGEFFDLCGLRPYLACSYGAQHAYSTTLRQHILEFGRQETERLGSAMPAKQITLAEDETFHPQVCLVAIEPVSNYIVAEQYEQQRDALTWNSVVSAATEGLNVTVVQVTGDGAKGLRAHALNELGAHYSPDLFHIQQDVGAAFYPALRGKVQHVASAIEQKQQEAAKWQACQEKVEQERAQGRKKPGPPVDYQKRIDQCHLYVESWEKIQQQWEERQEQAQQQQRQLSDTYHPFNLNTGAACKEKVAKRKLTACFDRLAEMAQQWDLGERSQQRLAKARRQLAHLWQTIAWFWVIVGLRLAPFDLNAAQRLAAERLISFHYLSLAAEKAGSPDERRRLHELAAAMRQQALARDGPLAGQDPEWLDQLDQTARQCAELFQRSSSCVEGRNGQLALRHHSFHRLDGGKLPALTVLHNFHIRRPDGTTAAERFFEAPPADMLTWLLERMPYPSRGAARRSADTTRQAA
jgi:hypothetical protein